MSLDKKNIYLIIGVLVLGIFSWNFTIKNTFNYKIQYDQLAPELILKNQEQLSQLQVKNRLLDKGLAERNINAKTVQTALFEVIADNDDAVKIADYNNQMGYNTVNERVTYHQIALKGDYNDLITTINALLQSMGNVQMLQLDYKTKQNFRTRKTSLTANVILEERQVL